MKYWEEAFCAALEDAGLPLPTDQQIKQAASVLEGAHENYGMAHGYDCIPNPVQTENDRLSKLLKDEREKVHCRECNGHGRIESQGPYHGSNTQCWKCHGEGKHKP
jgi:hypothetical protein